jgi:hypothetical protein
MHRDQFGFALWALSQCSLECIPVVSAVAALVCIGMRDRLPRCADSADRTAASTAGWKHGCQTATASSQPFHSIHSDEPRPLERPLLSVCSSGCCPLLHAHRRLQPRRIPLVTHIWSSETSAFVQTLLYIHCDDSELLAQSPFTVQSCRCSHRSWGNSALHAFHSCRRQTTGSHCTISLNQPSTLLIWMGLAHWNDPRSECTRLAESASLPCISALLTQL